MLRTLFFVFGLVHCTLAHHGEHSKKWLTLDGAEPLVIARGGYSGLFPDSSQYAFKFAISTSLPNVTLFCDLQLTKDGRGICQTSLELGNSTTIAHAFPDAKKAYNVDGKSVTGWFALDYAYDQLSQNVSFSSFYRQHKLDPASYIQKKLTETGINYISSPEIDFLKKLNEQLDTTKTKLIFRFMDKDSVEPTTKQTYGSILKKLSDVRSFASGILVPKEFIWPVNREMYLEAATSLVADAHKRGLQVYASGFSNDNPASYNYSYDPTTEYLQFIDNSKFSVDGLLTDFPSTASESIACIAHHKNASRLPKVRKKLSFVLLSEKLRPLIISHNGASGIYADCTNLAYERAIEDGADIIDCSVQLSKDRVAFCLGSADLSKETTAQTAFLPRSTNIPEIQKEDGIFSFDLTWNEIQTLKPELSSPFQKVGLRRNPANKNKGHFMTLFAFLELARTKAGLAITDVVAEALSNATFDKQQTQKVLIQSDDNQVLLKFKNNTNYQKVLLINEDISAAPNATVQEIRKYADAVTLRRSSIITISDSFATGFTTVVDNMRAANLSVYAFPFMNEFVSLMFDYFSDPLVELATYLDHPGVDGVITDFPATANAYLRSPCSDPNAKRSYSILRVKPGALLELVPPEAAPPVTAPAPVLNVADVVDPPLAVASSASLTDRKPNQEMPKLLAGVFWSESCCLV
ncbi:unnamed protein product [Thlaspi arvense]|uniref:glycerophosphodiester phosphodiesterase n=1 Tax=Thlaspi arvense TaxID=13288 RepID=A0AAU9RS69_THLAR|nr:unnamed protein product [Thlaspi arvense]